MGLTNDERSSLVELRLEKAKRFIAEAEQMLSMGLWDLAANIGFTILVSMLLRHY